jgi:16S rRNA (adenine1518-N6/adenine1519-N6)-dimethyltransferase
VKDAVSPRAALERHGLRPKHSFGQNFLADTGIATRIAELATTPPGGTVVEIGAGLGALTQPLLGRASRVFAIERDRDLVPVLTTELAESVSNGTLTIVEADAKRFDYEAAFRAARAPRVLAGNLPYQLTGPLLEITVGLSRSIEGAVFMVQKEVADRLSAGPSTPDYGALTVFVRAAFAVERAFIVRRGAFYPQPNVDSAVVVLRPSAARFEETETFREVVKTAFSQRRKTLRNAWRALGRLDAERIGRAALAAGIDLDARGETLDVAAFAKMADEVEKLRS